MRNRQEESTGTRQSLDAQAAHNCLTALAFHILKPEWPSQKAMMNIFKDLADELGFDPEEKLRLTRAFLDRAGL